VKLNAAYIAVQRATDDKFDGLSGLTESSENQQCYILCITFYYVQYAPQNSL